MTNYALKSTRSWQVKQDSTSVPSCCDLPEFSRLPVPEDMTMIRYDRMTIKQKIIAIIMLISLITLSLGATAFIFNDRFTAKDTMA